MPITSYRTGEKPHEMARRTKRLATRHGRARQEVRSHHAGDQKIPEFKPTPPSHMQLCYEEPRVHREAALAPRAAHHRK
jgi:hypothetical protein